MSAEAKFLAKHGIKSVDAYMDYHYIYGLYASYLVDAMERAEEISDGLCFDEDEVCALFTCLKEAKEVMQQCRRKSGIPFPMLDPAEIVALKGCRIEAGKIIGNVESARQIAREWFTEYKGRKGANPFCFEAAVYILFMLQEDINFDFLQEKGRRDVYSGERSQTGRLGIQPEEEPALWGQASACGEKYP